VNTNSISIKSSRPTWILLLAGLAALPLGFAWRGAGRIMRMHTEAASNAEFVMLKIDADAKIVVEVADASGGSDSGRRIRGKLLEKQDETHYTRTSNPAAVMWGNDTVLVMGKGEDIHAGAILHITGKVSADRSIRARQIVILTGYVQVK